MRNGIGLHTYILMLISGLDIDVRTIGKTLGEEHTESLCTIFATSCESISQIKEWKKKKKKKWLKWEREYIGLRNWVVKGLNLPNFRQTWIKQLKWRHYKLSPFLGSAHFSVLSFFRRLSLWSWGRCKKSRLIWCYYFLTQEGNRFFSILREDSELLFKIFMHF